MNAVIGGASVLAGTILAGVMLAGIDHHLGNEQRIAKFAANLFAVLKNLVLAIGLIQVGFVIENASVITGALILNSSLIPAITLATLLFLIQKGFEHMPACERI